MEDAKKAVKAERRLVGAGKRQKFVGLCGRHAEKMCQKGVPSNDADKFEVLRNVMWKTTDPLRRIVDFVKCVPTLRTLPDRQEEQDKLRLNPFRM